MTTVTVTDNVTKKASRFRGKRDSKVKTESTPATEMKKLFPDSEFQPKLLEGSGYHSQVLAQASSSVTVMSKLNRSYYAVDIQQIFSTFLDIERFVHRLDRRGGWKRLGYLSGVWLRSLVERLQRIAIETELLIFDQSELLTDRISAPTIIVALINQFGIFLDTHTNTIVAPYVTRTMIEHLLFFSDVLIASHPVGGPPANVLHPLVIDPVNWGSWAEWCYGRDPYLTIAYAITCKRLREPFTPSLDPAVYGRALASVVIRRNVILGVAIPTLAQQNAISGVPNPISAAFAVGVAAAPLGAIAGVDPNFVAELNDVQDTFVSHVDPTGGFIFVPAYVSRQRVLADRDFWENEVMEIKARFTAATVSLSPEGGKAPLCVVDDASDSCSSSTCVRGTTIQEFLFGVLLDNSVIWLDARRLVFNVATTGQQSETYSTTPFPFNRSELLMKSVRECVQRRKG